MVIKILIALAVIVVVLVVVVATRPSEFRVQRTATMSAPAPVVFGQVNDFHKWEAWSPYAKRDPAMKKTIEGAPAGVGAIYTWSGNHAPTGASAIRSCLRWRSGSSSGSASTCASIA